MSVIRIYFHGTKEVSVLTISAGREFLTLGAWNQNDVLPAQQLSCLFGTRVRPSWAELDLRNLERVKVVHLANKLRG